MSLYVQRNEEVISADSRSLISKRYCTVTSAMNREFWNITSDRQNSIYVGSYGRGTAIDTSDIDILMSLPESYYNQFNSVYGNGQSRLLQVVRQAILVRYPRSEVRADGQVVKINFSDGMFFEILPAFKNWDGSYRYPDTNMGGNWRSTNPKAEQDAMKNKNISSNGLLFDTCKHLRYVRDNYFRSYHLSGIVIDSFVYQAIGNWRWLSSGESSTSAAGTYEKILLDYYNQHFMWGAMPLSAPGSNQQVSTDNSRDCLGKVLRYVVANSEGEPLSYTQFKRLWQYIVTRTVKERSYYRYENGKRVKHTVKPVLGERAAHNGKVVYSLDFEVTPHLLRHTYITNLIHASVDPKTVQYLAGHENSKITMDIYAKAKYNRPDELAGILEDTFTLWDAE